MKNMRIASMGVVALLGTAGLAVGQTNADGSPGGPLEWNGGKEILEAGDGSFVRNRSQWINIAGRVDVAEDFADVQRDLPFRGRWADFTGWRLRQIGSTTLPNFRNELDTPPSEYVDNNGTTNASCWTDYPEINTTGIAVVLEFERPVQGWGAEFWGAASGERLDIEFLDRDGVALALMGATKTSSIEQEFIGYIAPPGTEIKFVRFKSRHRRLGTGGEGFGMDDMMVKFADGAGCYPDCDTSSGPSVLDVFDFLCFQNRYAAQDPYACDCDTSTGQNVCDILDFLCYQNRFATGCP